MNELDDSISALSATGLQRREAILRAALGQSRRRVRHRQIRRVSLGAAVVLGVAAIAWARFVADPRAAPSPNERVVVVPPESPVDPAVPNASRYRTFTFSTIKTDRAIARSVTLKPTMTQVTVVDDDQLLRSLHDAGVDAGIATVGRHTQLVMNTPPMR